MFIGRMNVSEGKALRYIWLYKAYFDGPDPQPCSLIWLLACVLSKESSAQRKLLMMKAVSAQSISPSGGRTGVLCVLAGDGVCCHPPALLLRSCPWTVKVAGRYTKVIELLAGSSTLSCSLGIPQLSAVLH